MASVRSRVMEKTIQLQQQQQPPPHEALKCPRCDSSNTKFCYYNNYSLSQPRHFCKACKRYWTRGGTLRNVPVGGGCRKNKRVKRPPITSTTTSNAPATQSQVNPHHHTNPNPNNNNNNNNNHDHQNQIRSSSTTTNSNHHLNPLFYGLIAPYQNPNNYPRFDTTTTTTTTRVSSVNENHLVSGGYGTLIQPQHMINASESFGFSVVANIHDHGSNMNFGSYINNNNNNSFMYGGGGSTCSAPSTMASLLASTFNQQQQRVMGGFAIYDHDGMMSSSNNLVIKDLKVENNSQNKIMDWNNNNNFHGGQNKSDHDQIEAVVVSSSDPNSILWDAEGGGWLDQTNNNIGSFVDLAN